MKDLSAILVFTLVAKVVALEEDLVHYIQDDVAGGSYKYYSLMHEGVIKVDLISHTGDSDIYISQTISKPTYDPENYCLQSSTCGEDILYIPQSFKRPVGIGIYGHPWHETSNYTLAVYQILLSNGETFDEENPTECFRKNTKKYGVYSFVVTLLWPLFDLIFHAIL